MRVLVTGYVLGEGRMSMVHYARVLHEQLGRIARPGDEFVLDGRPDADVAVPLSPQGVGIKVRKRLLFPLSLHLRRCDVLHVVDSDYAAGIPARKARRAVVTCHDLMPLLCVEYGHGNPLGRFGRHFLKRSLDRMAQCGRIVTDSEYTRECVLRCVPCDPRRVQVAHMGVDTQRFSPLNQGDVALDAFRRAHGLEGKRVVLHVGAGVWYKNVETLLEVVSRLVRAGHSNLVLLKVGRLTPDQQAQAGRLGLADRIVTLPRLTDDEIPLAYNAADLLLWPSWVEGFGLCVIEAMACGVPVVCSNGGSLPEVASDAAAVHDPRDVDGLADSCRRILEDPAYRQTLRDAGFQRATRFRWERTAREYYSVYMAVLAENA